MTVADLMRDDVVTARPDESAGDLARRMRDEGVGSVVVVDGAGRPIGLVTDRDLAVGPFAAGACPDERTAEAVMTPDPATVAAATGLMALSNHMSEAGVRRMPVVDEDEGALVGIVTMDDLHVLLAVEGRNLAAVIEAESPPY